MVTGKKWLLVSNKTGEAETVRSEGTWDFYTDCVTLGDRSELMVE